MKKLILVGNKPPRKKSMAKEIDSFDYIIRVNRMNYLGSAGSKIDGVFFEPNLQMTQVFNGGPNKHEIKRAAKIFMRRKYYDNFSTSNFDYVTQDQYNNVELINESYAIEATKFERLTSSIKLLGHLLNSNWKEDYKIYITCLDIENRAYLIDNDATWAYHKGAGIPEQKYLEEQLQLRNIFRLEDA